MVSVLRRDAQLSVRNLDCPLRRDDLIVHERVPLSEQACKACRLFAGALEAINSTRTQLLQVTLIIPFILLPREFSIMPSLVTLKP